MELLPFYCQKDHSEDDWSPNKLNNILSLPKNRLYLSTFFEYLFGI